MWLNFNNKWSKVLAVVVRCARCSLRDAIDLAILPIVDEVIYSVPAEQGSTLYLVKYDFAVALDLVLAGQVFQVEGVGGGTLSLLLNSTDAVSCVSVHLKNKSVY